MRKKLFCEELWLLCMPGFTPPLAELTALWALATLGSILSMLGSGILAVVLIRSGLEDRLDALVLIFCLFDLLTSFCMAFGRAFVPSPAFASPSGMCTVQANLIQFFSVASVLWVAVMSVALLLSLQQGRVALSAPPTLRSTLVPLCGTLSVSFALAVVAGATDTYGDATLWCWVSSARADLQLCFYYVPLGLAWVACLISIASVSHEVRKRLRDARQTPRAQAAAPAAAAGVQMLLSASRISMIAGDDIISRAARFLLVFLFVNAFGLANRAANIVLEAYGSTPYIFPLYALQALFTTMQGLGNALAYGKLCGITSPREWRSRGQPGTASSLRKQALLSFRLPSSRLRGVSRPAVDEHRSHGSANGNSGSSGGRHSRLPPPPPPVATPLAIFATTWNMGKCAPPTVEDVRGWLPVGRDLYAVGVQECVQLTSLATVMRDALGGEGAHTMHVRSIGSPTVGGYIAIVVLVRRELEVSGAIANVSVAAGEVRRGKKLLPSWLLARAANKGAVGCAFRFHGTTFAFVSCHLASDTKGRSKIGKRTNDTRAMLEGMELAYDVLGFELQLSCHHVIVLGDLNYRVALPAAEAVRRMAAGEWESLRAADELANAMHEGSVLSGFVEAPVRFVPSYRRVIGEAGRLTQEELAPVANGRGLDLDVLQRTFTTHLKGGERTPSFTDRILTCSLPDLAPDLTCKDYAVDEGLVLSDHRPVTAEISLSAWKPQPRPSGSAIRCRLWIHNLSVRPLMQLAAPAAVQVAFPMPAEDPSFALNRVAWLFGRPANSAYERVTWGAATAAEHGVSLTAEIEVDAVRSVHALVKVVDASEGTVGQAVITVLLPWLHPGMDADGVVPFEAPLVHRGQRMGTLVGSASALWLCGRAQEPQPAGGLNQV